MKFVTVFFAAIVVSFLSACQKIDPPEVVVTRYFEEVAKGSFFPLQEFLTPDGQYFLEELAAMPQVMETCEKQRPRQIELWSGIRTHAELQKMSKDRAIVQLTAEYKEQKTTLPILLFLINDKWCISLQSFNGPSAVTFQQRLMAMKGLETESTVKKNESADKQTQGSAGQPPAHP